MPHSFEFAKEVVTQLLTLATAVIGVSVTFAKDINDEVSSSDRRRLRYAWRLLIFSMACGIWTLMALTGALAEGTPDAKTIYKFAIRAPAAGQVLCFLAGIWFLSLHAATRPKSSATKQRTN